MRSSIQTIALALLGGLCTTAAAQGFPTRQPTLIVPFAAGGPSDALARVLARAMAGPLGQQVQVENVTGAGGTLAAGRAAQARADGYTMLLSHIGQAASVTLYRKLSYDPVGSFDGVGLIAEVPMVLVARKDFPAKDVADLLAQVRAQRSRLTYGNGGIGSASHFCGLLLMSALQAEMTTVSYRGSGPAMLDVLGGRLDLLCDQTTTTAQHIKGGLIRGYAVTMKQRAPSLPELPTLHDAGLRDFDLAVWYGLVVPRGTPRPVLDTLSAALRSALADAAVAQRFAEFGAQPVSAERATNEAYGSFVQADVAKWAPIIRAAGVYAD